MYKVVRTSRLYEQIVQQIEESDPEGHAQGRRSASFRA